jgi:hypothetical protein
MSMSISTGTAASNNTHLGHVAHAKHCLRHNQLHGRLHTFECSGGASKLWACNAASWLVPATFGQQQQRGAAQKPQ